MTRAGILLISIFWTSCGVSQTSRPGAYEDVAGYIGVLDDHAAWSSPERVAEDLRSRDDQVRVKALYLLGMTPAQAHREKWAQTPSTGSIGTEVPTPDVIRLTYADLGENANQQAILVVAFEDASVNFVAIATKTGHGWERIAAVDCWCKYDGLSEFTQLAGTPVLPNALPAHYELVVHASGGGTGIYSQNEAHFRVRNGELRPVLSFISRSEACDPTRAQHLCSLTRRWFFLAPGGDLPQSRIGILVEGRGRFASDTRPKVAWHVRDLDILSLQSIRCTGYRWNQQRFKYEPLKTSTYSCPSELR